MYFTMYLLECLRAMHEKDEATRKKHQLEHLGGTFEYIVLKERTWRDNSTEAPNWNNPKGRKQEDGRA